MTAAPPLHTARDRAVQVLMRTFDGRHQGPALLAEMQARAPLSPEDAALASMIVSGVARRRLTCEHIAAHFYKGRWAGLPLRVRVVLAAAVYQLCFLERVPDHAVVDQAVRQAGRPGKPPTGMVNAVLRAVIRARGDAVDWSDSLDPRRCVPIDGRRGRMFELNILPDPARRPLAYWIAATSHPAWLVERWHRRFKPLKCRQICWAGIRRPPLALRPNLMRTSADRLADLLRDAGHRAIRLPGSDAVLLDEPVAVADLAVLSDGLCQPQDATAQAGLALAPPSPGDLVLDLCAGVGTKATQAAELMGCGGRVLATDIDEAKLARIGENAARLGLTGIQTISIEQLEAAIAREGRPPDVILVDAPCTNTGVLARRPEARYRASRRALDEMTAVQQAILLRADQLAGPATRIIYTTCSLEREENEEQVARFCEETGRWRLHRSTFTLPDDRRDGGFAAVLAP